MSDYNVEDIGKRIRELRTRQGMTQHTLSLLADVDRKQISQLENGKSLLHVYGFKRVADVLGVTVDYLISGSDGVSMTDKIISSLAYDARMQVMEGVAMILKAIR